MLSTSRPETARTQRLRPFAALAAAQSIQSAARVVVIMSSARRRRVRYGSEISGGAPFDALDSGRQCERRLKRESVAVDHFLTTEPKFFEKCFLCKQSFQFGPHLYDGRHIASWGISVCRSCDAANWDGVVPDSHPDLIEHLKQRGVRIQLNGKGWLPLPPLGR